MSDCAICLECIHENIDTKTTECNHTFHANCFETWIKIKNSCPLCRKVFQTTNTSIEVPLQFWFNNATELAIPLVSIPYAQTIIDLSMNIFSLEHESSDSSTASRINDARIIWNSLPFALHPESNQPNGSDNFSRINADITRQRNLVNLLDNLIDII